MNLQNKETKILCTIGPSSFDSKIMKQMCMNGMNAIRINTAHGSFNEYKQTIDKIRKIDSIPIILDIKGPDLRIRTQEKILYAKGAKFNIGFSSKHDIYINFDILKKLNKGDKIMVQDGKFTLKVISKSKDHITVKSQDNCIIEPDKNVNVPNRSFDLPTLTPKDIKAIKFAKKEDIEYIALSFCRNKKDVQNLKKKLKDSGIKIIAKIENREGIDNIIEIIESSDGIMVARGDLGVELPPEEVPLLQKKIIKECNKRGKVVIVATQMLESMISNPSPTRAEISDVANAVLDGADCLMLSEETAIGRYPSEAVKIISKVSLEVEPQVNVNINYSNTESISDNISKSTYYLAKCLPITKIICLTYSGHTASKISRFRLNNIPLIAVTNSEKVKRQLMLFYSIKPVYFEESFWQHPIRKVTKFLFKKKIINKNDLLLITAGLHTLQGKKTNSIEIHKVSELIEFIDKNKK